MGHIAKISFGPPARSAVYIGIALVVILGVLFGSVLLPMPARED